MRLEREGGPGPAEPFTATLRSLGFLLKTGTMDFKLASDLIRFAFLHFRKLILAASVETRLNEGKAGGRETNWEAVSEFLGRLMER